jgi:hypothetical protein
MRMTIPLKSLASRSHLPACALSPGMLFGAILLGAGFLAAQTPAAPPAPAATHRPHHKHARPGAVQQAGSPAQATPVTPPAPATPHWPVNDHAAQASVTWNSSGLRIEAANSSLQQILHDVEAATGAKVEGMGADERVFGAFGPGQARDVLSQLLQGSGYNVLMVGDQGQGTPLHIVLSARGTGNSPDTASRPVQSNADNDADDNDADDQPAPAPVRPNFGTEEPVRTPQFPPDIQQRQQQSQPQSNPPN